MKAELLREHRYRRLWLARTITSIGGAVAPVALAFGVLGIGTTTDLGIVLGLQTAALAVGSVLGGAVADRMSRPLLMVLTDLLRFGSQVVLGTAFVMGDPPIWLVGLLAAAHGAGSAFNGPARSGLVAEIVEPTARQEANSLLSASENTAGVLALAAGGVLVSLTGPGVALIIDAATFLISAGLLFPIVRHVRTPMKRAKLGQDIGNGLSYVSSINWLPPSLGLFAAFQFLFLGTVLVLGPAVIEGRGERATSWAAVMICFTVGLMLGSLLAGQLKPRRPLKAMFGSVMLVVPVMILIGLSAPTWSIAPAHGLAGLVMGFGGVLWTTLLQQWVDEEMLGRVFALDWLVSTMPRPAGLAVAGLLGGLLGPRPVMLGAALLLPALVALVLSRSAVRSLSMAPSPTDSPAEAAADTGKGRSS